MELTFVGSGNAFAAEGRAFSGFLVNGKYQFDAPPTLLPQLKRLGVPPADIEVVFLSHFHADHFAGLPFLLLEYVYVTHRSKDLYIVGPPGVEAAMEEFATRCYPNVTKDAGYHRIYVEADPDKEQQAGDVTFRAFPMNHVKQDNMKAFGYRVRIGAKTLAYTGDTMYCEELMPLGEGTDVYVVDCTYSEGSGPEHMGLDDVKRVRERISPATTMVLTHLNGEPHVNGLANVLVAQDLKTFRFE
jgi:ribonuclease BN (tRNA processing enzyme)